jgi:hypothetical protein
LGRIFRELEPFALYPLDEYFNTTIRMPVKASSPVIELPRRESLRRQYYPLPKTA